MAKIFLDSAETAYSIANNDDSVYGSTGTESVTQSATTITGLTVDANVEQVNLAGAMGDYHFQQAGNVLKVYKTDGTTLVATVTTDGSSLVSFSGAAAVAVAIDGSGVMSIDSNDITSSIAALGISTATTITGLTVDANVEQVNLAGAMGDYHFQQAGNVLKVYKTDGTTLVATVTTDGSSLVSFSGAAAVAVAIDGSGVMSIDSNDITSSIAALGISTATTAAATLITEDGSQSLVLNATATTITGNIADITTVVGAAGISTLSNVALTVSDATSSAELAVLDDATTGIITATLDAGNSASFSALTDDNTNNALTITVTEAASYSTAATVLSAIGGKTSGVVTVNGDTADTGTITGTVAEATAALVTTETLVVVDDAAVTISDATSVSELNAIDAKTTGIITATLDAGTSTSFSALTDTNTNNALTITVTEASAYSTAATVLSAIGGKTSGVVTVNGDTADTGTITGTSTAVTAALVTTASLVVVDDAAVAISDTAGDIAATVYSAIGAKTAGAVSVNTATADVMNITGTSTEATAALVTTDSLVVVDDATVTLSDAAGDGLTAGTNVAVATLTDIDAKTDGLVTVTNAIDITGAHGAITAALTAAGLTADTANAVISDATITAANLALLDAQVGGTINTDTAALDITATDGAMVATAATDTFIVDAADTGLSITGLAVGDIIDFTADVGANLVLCVDSTVSSNGEYLWDNDNDILTYWDGAEIQAITLTGVATFTADGANNTMEVASLG